jgi:hypothetical protein
MITVLARPFAALRKIIAGGGGGSPGSTAALASGGVGSLRNDFGDFVGCRITPSSTLYAKSVGRWKNTGNSGTHTVRIVRASDSVVMATATVDVSGGSAGSYVYTQLGSAATLASGVPYYLVSMESNGGDQWRDRGLSYTPAADLTIDGPVFFSGGWNFTTASNESYVPPNFLYDLTP